MLESEYKEVIMQFSERFNQTIPEAEQKLTKKFQEYLYLAIKEIEDSDNKFIKKNKKSVIMYISDIAKSLIELDLESKKRELTEDKNLETIMNISASAFNNAQEILINGNIKREKTNVTEKHKKQLIDLLERVEPYNIEKARILVSETILDINYINNPNTEVLSLRLGRVVDKIKNMKNIQEER